MTAMAQIADPGKSRKLRNAFTVDVEDYFQVEAFKGVVAADSWDDRPSRVVRNTERILEILELTGVEATFFILGWVAERFPSLVRSVQAGGHEIASHGYGHQPVHSQSVNEFRADVRRAKVVLEDCSGAAVRGYRAPTFSITKSCWWAYDVLSDEGYAYSSSIYPISHDLYGMPSASRIPFKPLASSNILEIPIATLRIFGTNRPCGGGGYFRLLPYSLFRWCIERANSHDDLSCVFYCHPWEFDIDQPRIEHASLKSKFRHYLNIDKMEGRATHLLRDFDWTRMDRLFLDRGTCT